MTNPVLLGQAEDLPSPKLLKIQQEIEVHLERIEVILGDKYRLTLIANYMDSDLADADLLLTRSTLEKVQAAVDRHFPIQT